MGNFSQQLKDRPINYFKSNYEIKITSEQAEQYLSSMADLYLAISQKGERPNNAFD